jgi:predicted metal-dependent peptidase
MSELETRFSALQLRLRRDHPFFSALALFARVVLSDSVSTAATDGRQIFFNPGFADSLSEDEMRTVFMHEVLHAALLHVSRRGRRQPFVWNVAADVVVNGMLEQDGFKLPAGAVRDPGLAERTVEEIYEILLDKGTPNAEQMLADLLDSVDASDDDAAASAEGYWRRARAQAVVIARSIVHSAGTLGLQRPRDWRDLDDPRLDWRAALWRFVVQTPTDYRGFDRRFVHQGLYLENLDGESLRVWVAIDTSGSIDDALLADFMSELKGVLRAYPHIECALFFADAALYGPFPVTDDDPVPKAVGGGGTSFRPLFATLAEQSLNEVPHVVVYCTDGYGSFPDQTPGVPVLWLVAPGGLEPEAFPFGEPVMLAHSR